MRRTKEVTRYNVVSMRVSDDEKQSIGELANELSVNISDMMRSALQLYARSRQSASGVGQFN